MGAVQRVLIVGGGIGGLTLAVALRERGIATEVVELEARVLGVGITLTGTALRALNMVGLAAGCIERGFSFDFFEVSDDAGNPKAKNLLAKTGIGLPGAVGIQRPVLADLLTSVARHKGALIRYGLTVKTMVQESDAVEVSFTDGTSGRYDLVIGADGVFSDIRERLFGHAYEPSYVGQGVFRFTTKRVPSIENIHVFVGPKLKAGFLPMGAESMYLLLTMSYGSKPRFDESKTHVILKEALKDFTAPAVVAVRECLHSSENVIWRPFEIMLVPSPWYQGRVIIIGDAAHSMTPHLTAGGAMAIEDAVVLAESLSAGQDLSSMLTAFMQRRFDRVRTACEISLAICRLEQAEDPDVAQIYALTKKGYTLLGESF
jgi:2-polyprenyl-6-methoxyphenol hydroxylase-like FAD-dependent oxidoreductase